MINSDIPGDSSPYCICCGRQIGVGLEAFLLRVGTPKRIRGGMAIVFEPDSFDDDEDQKFICSGCSDLFDLSDADSRRTGKCSFCGTPLREEVRYFEFESGQFDLVRDVTSWIVHSCEGIPSRFYGCWDCVFDGIGEDDSELSKERLGIDLD